MYRAPPCRDWKKGDWLWHKINAGYALGEIVSIDDTLPKGPEACVRFGNHFTRWIQLRKLSDEVPHVKMRNPLDPIPLARIEELLWKHALPGDEKWWEDSLRCPGGYVVDWDFTRPFESINQE